MSASFPQASASLSQTRVSGVSDTREKRERPYRVIRACGVRWKSVVENLPQQNHENHRAADRSPAAGSGKTLVENLPQVIRPATLPVGRRKSSRPNGPHVHLRAVHISGPCGDLTCHVRIRSRRRNRHPADTIRRMRAVGLLAAVKSSLAQQPGVHHRELVTRRWVGCPRQAGPASMLRWRPAGPDAFRRGSDMCVGPALFGRGHRLGENQS